MSPVTHSSSAGGGNSLRPNNCSQPCIYVLQQEPWVGMWVWICLLGRLCSSQQWLWMSDTETVVKPGLCGSVLSHVWGSCTQDNRSQLCSGSQAASPSWNRRLSIESDTINCFLSFIEWGELSEAKDLVSLFCHFLWLWQMTSPFHWRAHKLLLFWRVAGGNVVQAVDLLTTSFWGFQFSLFISPLFSQRDWSFKSIWYCFSLVIGTLLYKSV